MKKLEVHKAHGPDGNFSHVLQENAVVLRKPLRISCISLGKGNRGLLS